MVTAVRQCNKPEVVNRGRYVAERQNRSAVAYVRANGQLNVEDDNAADADIACAAVYGDS